MSDYAPRSGRLPVDSLITCADCELTFAFPLPPPLLLDEYNRHYWTVAHGGLRQTRLAWATDAGLNAARGRYIIEHLGPQLPREVRVLEIGPGRGYLLAQLRQVLNCAAYDVVESDASCHALLKRHGASVFDSLEAVATGAREYDLIVLSHVLEHVADPVGLITSVVARLAPNGFLFIETPCKDHTFKHSYEPHLLFFDKQPMATLMHRVNCDVVAMTYHGPRLRALTAPSGLVTRWRDAIWTRTAELMLMGRDIDTLRPQQLRRYVQRLDPDMPHDEPSWWLRTLATRRSSTA